MGIQQFRLPDVGEGLVEAEIVSWKVKPGDTVKLNDTVVEIETAKSLVELPVPFAGTSPNCWSPRARPSRSERRSSPSPSRGPGDPVHPLPMAAPARRLPPMPATTQIEAGKIGGVAPGGRTAVLVGYGPKTTEAKRRPRKGAPTPGGAAAPTAEPVSAPAEPVSAATGTGCSRQGSVLKPTAGGGACEAAGAEAGERPRCRPGGGRPDRSGRDHHPRRRGVSRRRHGRSPGGCRRAGAGGQSETRIAVKGVRKVTAQAMVSSAFTAPHVTEWVTVDVSATMSLVDRLKRSREFDGVKVSPLLIVAKAVCLAVRRTPELNASWDEPAQEIVLKHSVNLGIAAATPRGLIVPNIKGADALPLVELGRAINALTALAREGRTQPADQAGGSFTITNVGVFGVDAGTPILNPGEAGILCFGAIRRQPWVVDDEIVPRWVTTLALSFDHRIVDGQQGSRFLADVAGILEDPARALMF